MRANRETAGVTYFKCVTCKARLYSAASPNGLVHDLCPGCGSLLEPVGDLTELVGYRSVKLRDEPALPRVAHGVVIDRFAEVLAAKRATAARDALDAERWLDDGGTFNGPAAASAAVPATPQAETDFNL